MRNNKKKYKYAIVRGFANEDSLDPERKNLAFLDAEFKISKNIRNIIKVERIKYFEVLIFFDDNNLEKIRRDFEFDEEDLFFAKTTSGLEVTKINDSLSAVLYRLLWIGK